jgi:transposase-like protein
MPKPSLIPSPVAESQHEAVTSSPSPSKPTRRTFTAAEKLRIVREADACTEKGQIGALLRREGIYDSLLATWRKALRLHGEAGMSGRRRGRHTTRDERDAHLKALERENARLRSDLERAQAVIEVQKKVSEILGIDLRRSEER